MPFPIQGSLHLFYLYNKKITLQYLDLVECLGHIMPILLFGAIPLECNKVDLLSLHSLFGRVYVPVVNVYFKGGSFKEIELSRIS